MKSQRRTSPALKRLLRHALMAGALIVLGAAVLTAPGGSSSGWSEALRAIGSSLVTVGAVGMFYDYFFVSRTLVQHSTLLTNAQRLQLDSLYPNRVEALPDICREIERAKGDLKICCIAGTDITKGVGAQAIHRAIKDQRNVHMRLLFLDWRSPSAFLRAWLEEEYYRQADQQPNLDSLTLDPRKYRLKAFMKSDLTKNTKYAKATLQQWHDEACDPTTIQVRFYRHQPSLFVVAVNEWVFVQPYHWGGGPQFLGYASSDPCIGKHLFLMKLARYSEDGRSIESHFDALWACSVTKRFLPATRESDRERSESNDPTNGQEGVVGTVE